MSVSTQLAYGTKLRTQGDRGMKAIARALDSNKKLDMAPRNWAELALHLGISKQAIDQWKTVPVGRYVFEIETLLGVNRSVLRPDIYPPTLLNVRQVVRDTLGARTARR